MSRSIDAQPESDTIVPVSTGRDIGIREIALLLVAASFASMMFDLPALAVIAGGSSVAAWAAGMVRPPRLTWRTTLAVGLGLVVTYMWWPDNDWAVAAVPLLWIGAMMVAVAAFLALMDRTRRQE